MAGRRRRVQVTVKGDPPVAEEIWCGSGDGSRVKIVHVSAEGEVTYRYIGRVGNSATSAMPDRMFRYYFTKERAAPAREVKND